MNTIVLKQINVNDNLPLTNTKVTAWDICGDFHEAIISEKDLREHGLTNWYRRSDYKPLKDIIKWAYADV